MKHQHHSQIQYIHFDTSDLFRFTHEECCDHFCFYVNMILTQCSVRAPAYVKCKVLKIQGFNHKQVC